MRRHFRFEDGNAVKQVETLLPNKYLDLKKPEIDGNASVQGVLAVSDGAGAGKRGCVYFAGDK